MGLFSFKKKEQKSESLDLPPPPVPEAPLPSSEVRIVTSLPDVEDVPSAPEEPMALEPVQMDAEPAAPILPTRTPDQPLFVSVDDYQEVLGSITYIRNKLGESDELVKKLNTLKVTEEKEFDAWRNQLEDLQRKLSYVEDVIFASG